MGKDLKGKELGIGISQRKDGRYEGRFSCNNKKYSVYSNSLSECKRLLKKRKEEVMYGGITQRTDVTLWQWFDKWFLEVKMPLLKKTSISSYKRKFTNTFGKIIGEKRLTDLDNMTIQTAISELVEKNYSSRTIRDAVGVMRICLDVAVINGYIRANPCAGLSLPSHHVVDERRCLSVYEQELLFKEIEGKHYEELYKFLLLTGIRIGELGCLTWDDINFEEKYIDISKSLSCQYENGEKILVITTPKTTNSYRKIPFFEETETILKKQKEKQDKLKKVLKGRWRCPDFLGNIVFTTTMGSPITRYVLQSDINNVVMNINANEEYEAYVEEREPYKMEKFSPHATRHTTITRLLDKGMKPHIVQKIVGHANIATTSSYTHALRKTVDDEVNKIGNMF